MGRMNESDSPFSLPKSETDPQLGREISTMTPQKRPDDRATAILWVLTFVVAFTSIILLLCAGLRFGRPFLGLKGLSAVGSFLSGVLTPLAIGWAARGFYLQKTQMQIAQEGVDAQLALQRNQLRAQQSQINEDRKRHLWATTPRFVVTCPATTTSSILGTGITLKIINAGVGATSTGIIVEQVGPGTFSRKYVRRGPAFLGYESSAWEVSVKMDQNVLTHSAIKWKVEVHGRCSDGRIARASFESDVIHIKDGDTENYVFNAVRLDLGDDVPMIELSDNISE